MKSLLVLILALASSLAQAANYRIDHMDPPSWWVGMQVGQVQLMVHGPQLADLEPSLQHAGVRIASVTRVANPNYLFITLDIAPTAAAGTLKLQFKALGQPASAALQYAFPLQAREAGSRLRKGFDSSDIIYEVMPDRFANGDPLNDSVKGMPDKADRQLGHMRHGGDIAGITQHLDYLAAMGFTQLWPTPLVENNAKTYSYHGYAATDFYRIDARYGSNEDYRKLAVEARKRGIGLISDVVLSHISSEHWWMKDMPTPDWINHLDHFVPTQHHRMATQDPYGSKEDKLNYTTGWFTESMPDMNQANPLMANYLIQNNIWWIEYAGLSGLRVDTYGYSDIAFLTEYSRRIMDEYPNLNMVGEEWHKAPSVVARWQRGKVNFDGYVSHMPSMMDFPVTEVMRNALASNEPNSFKDVYEMVSQDHLYPNAANLVLFEGNHDVPRMYSVVGEDIGLWQMDLAFIMTMPRIPQFYSGTEILMTSTTKGRDDASYRQDFPGGWAGDKVNGFTGAGLSSRQQEAQAYVKKLANWRRAQAVIHHGKLMHFGAENDTYVYFRYDDKKKVMVAFNKNKTEMALDTRRFREMILGAKQGTDVITGKAYALDGMLKLPARSVLILELDAAR
jgi:glycosidase